VQAILEVVDFAIENAEVIVAAVATVLAISQRLRAGKLVEALGVLIDAIEDQGDRHVKASVTDLRGLAAKDVDRLIVAEVEKRTGGD